MYYSTRPQTYDHYKKGNVSISTSVKRNSDHQHNYQSNKSNIKNSKYHIHIDDHETKSQVNLNINISVDQKRKKQNQNQFSFSNKQKPPITQTQFYTQRKRKPQFNQYIPKATQRKHERKQKQFRFYPLNDNKNENNKQKQNNHQKQQNNTNKIVQQKQSQKEKKQVNESILSQKSSHIMSQYGQNQKAIPDVINYNQFEKKDYANNINDSDKKKNVNIQQKKQKVKQKKQQKKVKQKVKYKKPNLQAQRQISQRIYVPKTVIPKKITTVEPKIKANSFKVYIGSPQQNQQIFKLHKNRYLDKLRQQSRKKSLNKTLSNRKDKRSLSPQCQIITERLYYGSINKQPCSRLQRQIRFCKRKKMEQLLKQYTFLKRYLTQNQIHDILEQFQNQGLPQYKWPMKIVELVHQKLYKSKKK